MPLILSGDTGISGVDGSAGTPSLQGTDSNTGVFYATDIVGISTNGSERMRIDSSGNVGIGTSSPATRLDVNGSVTVGSTGSNDRVVIVKSTSVTGIVGSQSAFSAWASGLTPAAAINIGSTTNHPVVFGTNNIGQVIINNAGNVGINIDYGLSRLTVGGQSAGANGAYATNTGSIVLNETSRNSVNDVGGFEFKASVFGSGYGAKLMGLDNGTLAFGYRANSATWTESMRIDSSGNVGIGTSSPNARLSLGTSVGTAGQPNQLVLYEDATLANRIGFGISSGQLNIVAGASTSTVFYTNGANERMRIDSSGNVQIGTTGQSARLAVNGVVYTMPSTVISSPVNGTWYTVGTATFNSVWQLTMRSVKSGNEQFSIYHVYIVVGGLVSLPQISNYTVGAGCGNAVRATNAFPAEGEIQVQINTTSVNDISVTLTRLS